MRIFAVMLGAIFSKARRLLAAKVALSGGLLMFSLMLSLMMGGCSSSRGKVHRGTSGSVIERPSQTRDYAAEVSDPMAHALIAAAQKWIGTPYVYGGDSRDGTDCSGFVMKVYGEVCQMKIPRTTRDQVKYCTRVATNSLRPGDLVFFGNEKSAESVSHVGMYVGDGCMIHASSSRGVIVSNFLSGYWGDRYFTGARVDGAPRAYAMATKTSSPKSSAPKPSAPQPGYGISPPIEPNLAAASALDEPEIAAASTAAVVSESFTEPAPTMSIDLLDLIINQKVDSIFSSQFVD